MTPLQNPWEHEMLVQCQTCNTKKNVRYVKGNKREMKTMQDTCPSCGSTKIFNVLKYYWIREL